MPVVACFQGDPLPEAEPPEVSAGTGKSAAVIAIPAAAPAYAIAAVSGVEVLGMNVIPCGEFSPLITGVRAPVVGSSWSIALSLPTAT